MDYILNNKYNKIIHEFCNLTVDMKIFYSENQSYKTKIDKDAILSKFQKMGAYINSDNFGFLGLAGTVDGYVESYKDYSIIHIRSQMSGGVKLFYIFWLLGTGFSFIYSLYEIIMSKKFDWLPLFSIGLLIFGVLFFTMISISQINTIKHDIKRQLKIR